MLSMQISDLRPAGHALTESTKNHPLQPINRIHAGESRRRRYLQWRAGASRRSDADTGEAGHVSCEVPSAGMDAGA